MYVWSRHSFWKLHVEKEPKDPLKSFATCRIQYVDPTRLFATFWIQLQLPNNSKNIKDMLTSWKPTVVVLMFSGLTRFLEIGVGWCSDYSLLCLNGFLWSLSIKPIYHHLFESVSHYKLASSVPSPMDHTSWWGSWPKAKSCGARQAWTRVLKLNGFWCTCKVWNVDGFYPWVFWVWVKLECWFIRKVRWHDEVRLLFALPCIYGRRWQVARLEGFLYQVLKASEITATHAGFRSFVPYPLASKPFDTSFSVLY